MHHTKADEIKMLQGLADALGPDTYCGPWLKTVIPEIEREIGSDYIPTPWLPAEAHREAASIIARANAEAFRIIEGAKVEAARLMKRNAEEVGQQTHYAAAALRLALKTLERA